MVGPLDGAAAEDRVAHAGVEAVDREERRADVTRPERVTAAAALGARPAHLAERVHGEAAGAVEPLLVAGARERLEAARSRCRRCRGRCRSPSPSTAGRRARPARPPRGGDPPRGSRPQRRRPPGRPGTTAAGSDRRSPRRGLHPRRRASSRARPRAPRCARGRPPCRVRAPPAGRRRAGPAGEQRSRVAHDPVRRREASVGLAVEPLRPEPVRLALAPDGVGDLPPGFGPALIARPAPHRRRGDERARGAPHDLVRLALDALLHPSKQVVREPVVPGQLPGDEEDARLAGEQPGLRAPRQLDPLHQIRLLAPALDRARRRRAEVEGRRRRAAPPQSVQRPQHPGGARVQRLERQRCLPGVPLVRRPELVGVESGVRVGHHHRDPVANAAVDPRLVGQWLVRLRPVEHGRTLAPGQSKRVAEMERVS